MSNPMAMLAAIRKSQARVPGCHGCLHHHRTRINIPAPIDRIATMLATRGQIPFSKSNARKTRGQSRPPDYNRGSPRV